MAYTKPGKPGSRSHMPDSKNGTSMILFNLRKNMYKEKRNEGQQLNHQKLQMEWKNTEGTIQNLDKNKNRHKSKVCCRK